MAYSEEGKVFIKVMRQERVVGEKFFKEFTNKNWSLSSLKKLLTKSDQMLLWSVECGVWTANLAVKCTARIAQNVDSVVELV